MHGLTNAGHLGQRMGHRKNTLDVRVSDGIQKS